jgi:hypothetical protein
MQRVLVVGTPRGGTTWVAQALAKGRGVRYVHEPDGAHEAFAFRARRTDDLPHYPVLRPGGAAVEYSRLWNGVFSGGRASRAPWDALARWAFQGVSGDTKRAAATGGTRTLRLRLAEGLAQPRVADPGVAVVLAKSVNAGLAAEWIYAQWRPAVLVVRRDLRNVLASWNDLGLRGPAPERFEAVRAEARRRWDIELRADDDTARAVGLCAVIAAALHDDAGRHGWAVIGHEAACADPLGELSSAAARVGIEWTETAAAFVRDSNQEGRGYQTQRVAADLPSAWKAKLAGGDLRRIDEVIEGFPESLRAVLCPA